MVKERERQEELAVVQDWRQMQSMGYDFLTHYGYCACVTMHHRYELSVASNALYHVGCGFRYYTHCRQLIHYMLSMFTRWRELAARFLCEAEEREPLYNQWNSLWQEGVVLVSNIVIPRSVCLSFDCQLCLSRNYESCS